MLHHERALKLSHGIWRNNRKRLRMAASWADKDDHTLLQLLQEGSSFAFAELVKRHHVRFYRVAYRFLSSQQEAEDVVQEAFLKLWERPDIWQAGHHAKFTTWFYRIVVNMCYDRLKKKAPLPIADELAIEDDGQLQDEQLREAQEQAWLEAAIAELPERQRTALNLCFYEEVSNKEAAEIMGVNLKALQSLIMRAKTTLKERMDAIYTKDNRSWKRTETHHSNAS